MPQHELATQNGERNNEDRIGSPMWWLSRLRTKLMAERGQMQLLQRYYEGDHPLPYIPRDIDEQKQYREMLQRSRLNFPRLVVDIKRGRLKVKGFQSSESGDDLAADDRRSWDIWQHNQLDAESQLAFLEALVKGRSYFSVWKSQGDDHPTIAVEDPTEVIVEHVPGKRRERAAGLKLWTDDWTGAEHANVYLPDAVYKFEQIELRDDWGEPVFVWREREDEVVDNPSRVVPIIPLVNRRSILGNGESEISDIIPITDRINAMLFNQELAAWFSAWKRKWATGLEIPVDPETDEPIEPFKEAVQRMFISENPDTKFGEFSETDLKPFVEVIDQYVLHIAVLSRVPRYFLIPQSQAEARNARSEADLVTDINDKQQNFGEALEEVMRVARSFPGEEPLPEDAETVWAPAQFRSGSDYVDELTKKRALAIPIQQLWLEAGYSPTQMRQFMGQLVDEELMFGSNGADEEPNFGGIQEDTEEE